MSSGLGGRQPISGRWQERTSHACGCHGRQVRPCDAFTGGLAARGTLSPLVDFLPPPASLPPLAAEQCLADARDVREEEFVRIGIVPVRKRNDDEVRRLPRFQAPGIIRPAEGLGP